MSDTDEDDYGEIADEDLIGALSQPYSSTLPSEDRISEQDHDRKRRRKCKGPGSGASGDEEGDGKAKKKKYRIHMCTKEVPPAQIIGATQADGLPESPSWRIRGAIYRKPREEPPPPSKPPVFAEKTPRYVPPPARLPQPNTSFTSLHSIAEDEAFARELQDLPDGAFDSSPGTAYGSKRAISIGSSPISQSSNAQRRLVAPQNGLMQTTLFGGRAPQAASVPQAKKVFNYKVDKPLEPPTHHGLNKEALSTWIYPLNLGAIRDYQYSIVRNGLFSNLLVALPTGLGKTFIAATIMFNFYRWTKDAQIVFVAPTKPLVSQQVSACYGIVGIPRFDTTMLTGEQAPALRADEWAAKRVFFMTPQTFINDLSTGIADPKKIVLLVVDEAHRATGEYAYVKVVQFLRRFNTSFRILALTATPGSTVEGVQEVIDALEISKIEIRTEESIDIQQYTHQRNIDQVLLDPSEEIIMVKDLFSKALQPLLNKLCAQNGYWNKDPMALTLFGMLQARKQWAASDAGLKAAMPVKGMMNALFTVLASVAHSIKLLNFHGIGPFYSALQDFKKSSEEGKSKTKKQIFDSPDFKRMMDRIQSWINKEDFIGHPKLTYLCDTILNHFLDAGGGRLAEGAPPSSTRVIVFSEFRESAEDITRVLNRHGPMIRASVFVGQADSKRSQGMNQQTQIDTIKKFQSGIFNVIVATSIGEEGLDIGQVDLIVCYDASASPIRMLQRMGRTGRKRAGNIVLLLMRGKEEENFVKAKDNYEKIQRLISNGDGFNFRSDLSARIIPKDIAPTVERTVIDIPPENSHDNSLPIPRQRISKAKKKPAKKFHMPDGVETGFRKASRVNGDDGRFADLGITLKTKKAKPIELAEIPNLESVVLGPEETAELKRNYQTIAGDQDQEIAPIEPNNHPNFQRSLASTASVPHGNLTKAFVRMCETFGRMQEREYHYREPLGNTTSEISWSDPTLVYESELESEAESEPLELPSFSRPKKTMPKGIASAKAPAKRTKTQKCCLGRSLVTFEDESGRRLPPPAKRQQVRKRPFSMSAEESDGNELESGGIGPSSEGPGDDLAQSEEISEDESQGSSLEDFVVDERSQHSTLSSSPPPILPPKPKSFYMPSQLTLTQDTDDLPELDDIVTGKTKDRSRSPVMIPESDDDNDDVEGLRARRRGMKKQVVEDDSDE